MKTQLASSRSTATENRERCIPSPLAGVREGGKPSGTVRDNTLTPDLESELRTPQGGGEKDAAKQADTQQGFSPGPFDRQLGGDRFLAFDIAFRNCLIATGSFRLVQRAIAALDHGLGGFGHPELRNPD